MIKIENFNVGGNIFTYPDPRHCLNIVNFVTFCFIKSEFTYVLICFRLRAISTASSPILHCVCELIGLCLYAPPPHLLQTHVTCMRRQQNSKLPPGLSDVPFSPRNTREQLPNVSYQTRFCPEMWSAPVLATQAAHVMASSKKKEKKPLKTFCLIVFLSVR
jgi:hypothetical protein